MEDLLIFKKFIVEAKKNSFASSAKNIESSRPNSKDYSYRKYDYFYHDSHVGNNNFIGQEIIWKNEKIYWGLNYKGELLVNDAPSGFIRFLKAALYNVSENNPFRGPESYSDGEFTYKCSWEGDINSFTGVEYILYSGKEIYKLNFHGGKLS
ncbi:MAG: XRE family transcriptional regulator [Clostridium sp.]|nr:XRE family transcriptional regulator [Clostridium sp.]